MLIAVQTKLVAKPEIVVKWVKSVNVPTVPTSTKLLEVEIVVQTKLVVIPEIVVR